MVVSHVQPASGMDSLWMPTHPRYDSSSHLPPLLEEPPSFCTWLSGTALYWSFSFHSHILRAEAKVIGFLYKTDRLISPRKHFHSRMWRFDEKCPHESPSFEHVVLSWWHCLGKFRLFSLAGRSVSPGTGFENKDFTYVQLAFSASCGSRYEL